MLSPLAGLAKRILSIIITHNKKGNLCSEGAQCTVKQTGSHKICLPWRNGETYSVFYLITAHAPISA